MNKKIINSAETCKKGSRQEFIKIFVSFDKVFKYLEEFFLEK